MNLRLRDVPPADAEGACVEEPLGFEMTRAPETKEAGHACLRRATAPEREGRCVRRGSDAQSGGDRMHTGIRRGAGRDDARERVTDGGSAHERGASSCS